MLTELKIVIHFAMTECDSAGLSAAIVTVDIVDAITWQKGVTPVFFGKRAYVNLTYALLP